MTTKKEEINHSFIVRLSPDESAAMRAAAEKARLPLATWARSTLMRLLDDEQKKSEAPK